MKGSKVGNYRHLGCVGHTRCAGLPDVSGCVWSGHLPHSKPFWCGFLRSESDVSRCVGHISVTPSEWCVWAPLLGGPTHSLQTHRHAGPSPVTAHSQGKGRPPIPLALSTPPEPSSRRLGAPERSSGASQRPETVCRSMLPWRLSSGTASRRPKEGCSDEPK